MPAIVENRAPRARCVSCGLSDIAAVCHHCSRPLCEDHGQAFLERRRRSKTHEFRGLGLDAVAPRHCDNCQHLVGRSPWEAPAALLVVLAATVLWPLSARWAAVFAAAGIAAAVAWLLRVERPRRSRIRQRRPPLPLVPNIDRMEVHETLSGELRLDAQGAYSAPVIETRGAACIAMVLGRQDLDRLGKYRRLFKVDGATDVPYSAGHVVIRGRAAALFDDERWHGNVLPLTGRISDLPFFAASASPATRHWRLNLPYRPAMTGSVHQMPIWLVPSLVPQSDQRAVEIDIQWRKVDPSGRKRELDRIHLLKLDVPRRWGMVESATVSWGSVEGGPTNRASFHVPADADPEVAIRSIEWKQVRLGDLAEPAWNVGPGAAPAQQRLRLAVRFENRIDLDGVLTGRLEAVFRGTQSGLEGVTVCHPLGQARSDVPRQRVSTTVAAEFSLSLAGLRHQAARVVPDADRESDLGKVETESFPGVVPDHETVIDLVNAMSEDGLYVKRVVENPPRSGGRANVANRYWDIAGRRYHGVYPVDFHVVLTGEEVHRGDVRAAAGDTRVRLTVHGVYASDTMEGRIVDEWERLHVLLRDTLRARPRVSVQVRDGNEPDGEHEPSPDRDATWDRRRVLQKRLDDATTALLGNQISEATYREITERTTGELDELDSR